MPVEAADLTPLMRNLSNEEIHGCDTCGRLYAWTHYHDNILGSQEDSDTLTRLDIAALKKRWQKEILEGERVTYLKAHGG